MSIQYLNDESLMSVVGGANEQANGSLIGFLDSLPTLPEKTSIINPQGDVVGRHELGAGNAITVTNWPK